MRLDEILIRVPEGQESGLPKIRIYADDDVKWKLNENTLQKKFRSVVTV
jgi:hypothetical protein